LLPFGGEAAATPRQQAALVLAGGWVPPLRCRSLADAAGERSREPVSRQERQQVSRRRREVQDLSARAERKRDGTQMLSCKTRKGQWQLAGKQAPFIEYISYLGRNRKWEKALKVYGEVKYPCLMLRSAAVAAATHAPEPKHAEELFEAMPVKTLSAYNSMINMHTKSQRIDEAKGLIEKLRAQKLKPDTVTFGSLIAGHARVGDVDAAVAVLDEMEQANVKPSKVAFGAAMGACTRTSDTKRVQELLGRMAKQQLEPNVVHLTSLLITYASRGDEGRALGVFEDMRQRGLEPDVVAYTALLNCLCSGQAAAKAEELWAEMQERPWKPTAFTYNAMLRILARAKATDRFYEVLREMDERGLHRNKQVRESLRRMRRVEDATQQRLPWLRGPLPQEEPWPGRGAGGGGEAAAAA